MGESFERQKNEAGETIAVSCDAVVLGMQQPSFLPGQQGCLYVVRLNSLELFRLHKVTQGRAINKNIILYTSMLSVDIH